MTNYAFPEKIGIPLSPVRSPKFLPPVFFSACVFSEKTGKYSLQGRKKRRYPNDQGCAKANDCDPYRKQPLF